VDQRDLVEQARKGDHDAFAALAGAAIVRLDAAARLILRDRELARDAVQDAMMRAARHRRRRPIEVELTVLDAPSVADASSQIIDRELLDRGLRALEPEWRAVVVLHYYLGMPLPEVAGTLGIPLGTAKSRLHRSIGVLRSTVGIGPATDSALVTEGRLA